jgi:hypothetical protein
MAIPQLEFVNQWLEDEMPIEFAKRKTIDEFNRYKKLSIKTKLKRLKDKFNAELAYLYKKYNMDMEVIENGGHPEIGYENTLPIKSLSDEAFNTLYRAKRRRSQCKSK